MENKTIVHKLTFNPFQENTYIIEDIRTNKCIIFDPGCMTLDEQSSLISFIESNDLRPGMLLNTHCHIDHILGNAFIKDKFGLDLIVPEEEVVFIDRFKDSCMMFQIPYTPTIPADGFLDRSKPLVFESNHFELLHCPGHSPGSVCFYNAHDGYLIGGDVLFNQSIGRTDLFMGSLDTLLTSIKQKLFVLPDHVVVYPGHGPKTTIGDEKNHNPFVRP